MSNLCWRCVIRKTSNSPQDLKFDTVDSSPVNSASGSDEKVCFSCNDLLLIDDQSKYCILRIPDEVKKVRRRKSNKFVAVQNTQAGLIGTYAIYRQDLINNEAKKDSIGGYLGEVFRGALAAAVSNDGGMRVTEAGISIEFTPELRINSDQEMYLSLKSCTRSLLLSQLSVGADVCQNQDFTLRQNQNSDLYINFTFSTRVPASLKCTEGFVFSMVVSYNWKSVYMLGRYVKLSRRISQSRWGFSEGDKNKITVDTSVEEVLSNSLKELVQFGSFTFSSSGREDVDVRMLGRYAQVIFGRGLVSEQGGGAQSSDERKVCGGRPLEQAEDQETAEMGRPFAIEVGNILSHHYLFYPNNIQMSGTKEADSRHHYSAEDFIQLFKETVWRKSGHRVEVPLLNFSDSGSVQKMNKEVNEKQKSYRCICYSSSPIRCNEYSQISEHLKLPITLNQRTPIRVLHRRPNINRSRKIYDLMISPINENYFILDLLAQAGTYIKEFVNGDLGRTSPSFGDLIKDTLSEKSSCGEEFKVIIVQLDVLNIH